MGLPRGRNFTNDELNNSVNEVLLYMQKKGNDDETNDFDKELSQNLVDIQERLVKLEATSSKNA